MNLYQYRKRYGRIPVGRFVRHQGDGWLLPADVAPGAVGLIVSAVPCVTSSDNIDIDIIFVADAAPNTSTGRYMWATSLSCFQLLPRSRELVIRLAHPELMQVRARA